MRSIRACMISEAEVVTVATTPIELIRQRFEDLKARNFSGLYAGYHAQSPFIEQFAQLEDYLEFAQQTLAEVNPLDLLIGPQRHSAEGVEVICQLCFELGGTRQTLYELALLVQTEEGWRYHSAQKLTPEEFGGDFSELTFKHFDQQALKIRF
jgi:SEC-C motif-containing protein